MIIPRLKKQLLTLVVALCLPLLLHAQEQLSSLPTLYITTNSAIQGKIKSQYTDSYYFPYVSGYLKIVAGAYTPVKYNDSIQIRGRGNSTWNLAKKPYRLKLSTKFSMLGMTSEEQDWVLLANHADKTLVRNALAFEISKACGIYFTPDYRFVDVVLNDYYIGNYMLTDQVERDNDRVDIEKMDSTNLTGGYLLEIDGFGDTRGYIPEKGEEYPEAFSSSIGNRVSIKYPDNDKITEPHREYIIKQYNAFEKSILNYNNTQAGYELICSYLDTTAFVNWYIANELTANPDGLWSIYLKKHRDDNRFYFGPLWDNDISFGNCNRIYSLANDGQSESIMLKCFSNNRVKELINKVLSIPPIRNMIAERWKALNSQTLKDNLIHLLHTMEEELNVSQQLNYQKWSSALVSRIYNEIYYGQNISYAMHMEYLRSYMSERIDYLDGFFASMANTDPQDPPLPSVDTIQYFNPEPYVWYQLQCQLNNKYLICADLNGQYQLSFTNTPETAGDWAKFELSCHKDEQNRSIYTIRNKASKQYVNIDVAKALIPLDPVQKTNFTLYPSPNENGHYGFVALSDDNTLNELGIDANGNVVSWPTTNKNGQREYQFIPDHNYFQSIFHPADPQQPQWSKEDNWSREIPNIYATAIIDTNATLELVAGEKVQVDTLCILPGARIVNNGTIHSDITLFFANDSMTASYENSVQAELISPKILFRKFDLSQSWYAFSLPLDIQSIRNTEMRILQPGLDYFLMEYNQEENRFDSLSPGNSLKPKAGPYLISVSEEQQKKSLVFIFDSESSYQSRSNKYNFAGNTSFGAIELPGASTYVLEDHLHFVLQDDQQQLMLPPFNAYFSATDPGTTLPDSIAIYNNSESGDTMAIKGGFDPELILVGKPGLLVLYNIDLDQNYTVFGLDGRVLYRNKATHKPEYLSLKQGLYLIRYKNSFYKIQIP